MAGSVVAGVYEKAVDRESAYEKLKGRVVEKSSSPQRGAPAGDSETGGDSFTDALGGIFGGGKGGSSRKDSVMQAMMKSAARSIGSTVGREIIRGVLGSILKR
jgi:hypothetical protein